jgi:hypothetical protein
MATDDIVTRLQQKYSGQLPICLEAADEIERLRKELTTEQTYVMLGQVEIDRLRKELKICQAERDHHQKWSKNYEIEIYRLRDQIKKKNSN